MKALHLELSKVYLMVAFLDAGISVIGFQQGKWWVGVLMIPVAALACLASYGHWAKSQPSKEAK